MMIMEDDRYLEMLKKAKQLLPKGQELTRFEVPKAVVQNQGRQTFVKNFNDITKALRRDPQHLARYLFKELAVPGSFSQELSLQGKFSVDFINKKIDAYTKEFVICEECGKPDTNLIKTDRLFTMKCEACGARKPVRSIK